MALLAIIGSDIRCFSIFCAKSLFYRCFAKGRFILLLSMCGNNVNIVWLNDAKAIHGLVSGINIANN